MSNPLSRRMALGVAGLALGGLSATAQAAPMTMTVPLSGAQQVPAGEHPGPRLRRSHLRSQLQDADVEHHVQRPVGTRHHGAYPWTRRRPEKMPVSKSGSAKGSASDQPDQRPGHSNPAQAQQLMAGDTYINIHTQAHPGGEIRGQIMPPKA